MYVTFDRSINKLGNRHFNRSSDYSRKCEKSTIKHETRYLLEVIAHQVCRSFLEVNHPGFSMCLSLFVFQHLFWGSPCPCKVYARKIAWNRNMSICQKDMVNSPLPKAFPHLEPAKDNHIMSCFYTYHIQNAQIMTCTLEFGQVIIFAQLKYPKA